MISITVDTIAVATMARRMVDAESEHSLAAQALLAGSEILRAEAAYWFDINNSGLQLLSTVPEIATEIAGKSSWSTLLDGAVGRMARVDIPESMSVQQVKDVDDPLRALIRDSTRRFFIVPIRHGDQVGGVAVFALGHEEVPSDLDGNSMLSLLVTASIIRKRLQERLGLAARLRATEVEVLTLRNAALAKDGLVTAFIEGRDLHGALRAAGARLGTEFAVMPHDEAPDSSHFSAIPGSSDHILVTMNDDAVDESTILQLARLIGLEFARRREQTATETRLTEALVRTIIEGTDAERTAAWGEASLLGVDTSSQPARVLVIGAKEDRLGTAEIERLRRQAARFFPHSLLTSYEGRIVLFVLMTDQDDGAALDRVIDVCTALHADIAVGISALAPSLSSSTAAVREALFAQRIAEHARLPVAHAERLGFVRMVARSWPAERVEEITAETLGPLFTLADSDGEELRRTLRVFLEHDRRPSPAAAELHIHVNTLRYRLKRISALLDADLDNSDDRLMVLLALKLDDTIGRGDITRH